MNECISAKHCGEYIARYSYGMPRRILVLSTNTYCKQQVGWAGDKVTGEFIHIMCHVDHFSIVAEQISVVVFTKMS